MDNVLYTLLYIVLYNMPLGKGIGPTTNYFVIFLKGSGQLLEFLSFFTYSTVHCILHYTLHKRQSGWLLWPNH